MSYNSFEFADEVCESLMGNLSTLAASNQTLELWTNCTASLNTAWNTGGDAIKKLIDTIGNGTMNVQTFLANYVTNPKESLSNWSMADVAYLLQKISQPGIWDPTLGAVWTSTVQTFGQTISAQQTKESSVGDTESKAQGGYMSQLSSAMQTVADLGNSAIGIISTAASALMSSFV